MNSDIYRIKLVFGIDEDRQRFENLPTTKVYKSDRTNAGKVSIRRFDVERDEIGNASHNEVSPSPSGSFRNLSGRAT
jgi:hypothetical protein